jgi:hypothetical protein
MDIAKLKAHGINAEIYGDIEPDDGLLESIRVNGILEPIVVTPDGTILSGHRRWKAALSLGFKDVPTRELKLYTDIDEQETLLEFNRQREKTFSQKMREAEKLKEIVAARAKEKQKAQAEVGRVSGELGGRPKKENETEKPLPLISGEGVFDKSTKTHKHLNETDTVVAKQTGMKRDTFTKAEKVYKKAASGDEKRGNSPPRIRAVFYWAISRGIPGYFYFRRYALDEDSS